MRKYIVYFGFNSDYDGYVTTKSKPIIAENEEEAALTLIANFEALEGIPCEVLATEEVKEVKK